MSTLRRSLGCILADELEIAPSVPLRRGTPQEQILSDWMAEHASVTWCEVDSPWKLEPNVIRKLCPPLNLQHNPGNPFAAELARLRKLDRTLAGDGS